MNVPLRTKTSQHKPLTLLLIIRKLYNNRTNDNLKKKNNTQIHYRQQTDNVNETMQRRVTRQKCKQKENEYENYTIRKGDDFDGFCLDTRAKRTLVGLNQLECLKQQFRKHIELKRTAISFRLGNINYQSIGSLYAKVPLPQKEEIDIKTHVVPINVPFLIGLDIFIEHGLIMDLGSYKLISKDKKWELPLQYLGGHLYIRPETKVNDCNFTMKEFRKMHYHFMYPSSGKLFSLLKKAYPYETNQDRRQLLERISNAYEICNEHSIPPFRFRAPIPEDKITFNREIAIYIMWLNGKPVLHIVSRETNFQNAIVISGKTSYNLWTYFVD